MLARSAIRAETRFSRCPKAAAPAEKLSRDRRKNGMALSRFEIGRIKQLFTF
jgi:hypothetical protein